jgi:hypothetical protein
MNVWEKAGKAGKSETFYARSCSDGSWDETATAPDWPGCEPKAGETGPSGDYFSALVAPVKPTRSRTMRAASASPMTNTSLRSLSGTRA